MRISFFSAHPYDEASFQAANHYQYELIFFNDTPLNPATASMAAGSDAICAFVNDHLDYECLNRLKNKGVKWIALRCAGFNNVDLAAARALNMPVVSVPTYTPEAVAEHTLALILTLNRQTHRAFNRVRENNFSLNGLLGFNLHGRTVGLIGTGQIGLASARILKGFGCHLLGYDPCPHHEFLELGGQYVDLSTVYQNSDIISLHCPLTPENYHMINVDALTQMKDGVMLINTSRGALIDTTAVIAALKSRKLGYLGLDVYEQEAQLFFHDLSEEIITDDEFQRLLTFPNVLITGHQGFFTQEALKDIAQTTLENLFRLSQDLPCDNELTHLLGEP
ncbi:D-lactate dehydrogenase [Allopseudospirillum japonicum]|uniref:D-lactate dehydrogenase n=1 Tax=Allopseudospirillum japonicum TaxID=64971 RepID=A0A1H6U6H9_9GAMM|nr:2-hydroxyacid dehydrogenase [Allopseudospirillum japonicum]SEI87949.1 D-lactate dehydrogenase [Allopseudospirillum japonicum]